MKLVCVGDVGVDRYMPENRLLPGGITANFIRQASKCFDANDELHLISVLGNDYPETDVAFAAVNKNGINCHINRISGKTPVQYIEINNDGEKNFTRYDPGVLKHFYLDENQINIMQQADLVMTPVYWQIKNVFSTVMSVKMEAIIAVDFSDFATDPDFELLQRYLDKIDVAFFGLSSNQIELIDKLSELANHHQKLFVITLGAGGSIAFRGDQKHHCNPPQVKNIIDTTGAGDAFAAGFLSIYGRDDLRVCLELGTQVAARTIGHLGSVPD